MLLDTLKEKKVLILGYGREGEDTLLFMKNKFPGKRVGIADRMEKKIDQSNVDLFFGEDYLDSIKNYDVIIKSPGVPLSLLNKYEGKLITSQSDIFLNLNKGMVVGVTGTKGKSTTCTAIYNALKEKGENVYLLGNIGEPVLRYLEKEGIFIYELSSFQLQTIRRSPEIAVILNIFKDHLDHHQSFDEYLRAKKRITDFQRVQDWVIYNGEQSEVVKMIEDSKAQRIPFDPAGRIKGSVVYIDPIIKTLKIFGISEEEARRAAEKSIDLPHRLELVGRFRGIDFYDDSAATIPEATIEALESLDDLDTLIVGGVDKGGDYNPLIERINLSDIRNLIIFPETGIKIRDGVRGKRIYLTDDMNAAVKRAFEVTRKDGSCLLSPASSSFNMFRNYKDRGEKFKSAVYKYDDE